MFSLGLDGTRVGSIYEPSPVLWIRIHFEPDPAFQVNPDPKTDPDPIWIQGFDDQKVKKKNTAEISFSFFDQNYTLIIPRPPHKGRPSYRRSLPPSKEYIQYLKFINLFSFFWGVIFALLDPNTDPGTQLNPDPIRIRIHNTGTYKFTHTVFS
jgi:hypothetical protein